MSVEAKELADYSARTMKRKILLGLLAGTFLVPVTAQAQMYPGQGISVNPAAINGGGYNSPYTRGNAYPDVIHLHMPAPAPVHHRHVAAKPKPVDSNVASTAPANTTPPPAPAPAPAAAPSNSPYPPPLDSLTPTDSTPTPAPAKHTHHAKAAAASTPAPAPAPAASDSGTGSDAALPLTLDPQAEHPVATPPKQHKHDKTASADSSAAPATTILNATPSDDTSSGMTRRSQILFPRGVPDISSSTVDKMRSVAADLTTLLGAGASRVQLDAYGGAPGDKGSDARRLSLKRALGIRQLLIEDGVPSEKIDVRALGGIDDGGAPDRVDVLVHGG